MITRVRVKNFRSLADVDVTLGPLTVLVGRNGAGKSAFVDALHFMRDALRSGIDEALRKRNGLAMLQTRHADGVIREMAFEVSVQLDDFSAEYGFALAPAEQGAYSIAREYLRILSGDAPEIWFEIKDGQMKVAPDFNTPSEQNKLHAVVGSRSEGNQFSDPPPVTYTVFDPMRLALPLLSAGVSQARELFSLLVHSNFYGMFSFDVLRAPQPMSLPLPLNETGVNLASLLQRMQASGMMSLVISALRCAMENIEDIRVIPIGSHLAIQLKHRPYGVAEVSSWFDLSQESDGTIHFLTTLAALYQTFADNKRQSSLIGIEEPETALYPAAISVLSGVIKEAALNQQVIVTTQSPDFISDFSAEHLRIVEQKRGYTHIGPILAEQLDIINRNLFTSGDLLRIEGLRTTPFEAVSVENG